MRGVLSGDNDSGFHGYSYSSLYPGMYAGPTQQDDTIPDPAEQQALAGIEDPAPRPVDSKQKMGILSLVIGLVVLLVLFGVGR